MLSVRDLAVEVGGRLIVDGVSFTVRARDKVGLVGRNGAGKTSMLKMLGGDAEPKAGTVRRTGGLGYLSQDPRLDHIPDDITAVTRILGGRGHDDAAARIEKLRVAMEADPTERNVRRFSQAEERFRLQGGYAADGDARRIGVGLGLDADRFDLPLGALSGGERRRVELARILFGGSDVLLLDEPTNHLDTDAKEWVLRFLRSYNGALIVISHDLDLLDESITRVLHLDRVADDDVGTLVEYRGTYSQYLVARERDEARLAKIAGQQQAEITRLRTLADSMRHSTANRARKAKSLDSRVDRLRAGAVDAPKRKRKVQYRFPEPPHCGRDVLRVDALAKQYGALRVFDAVTFDVGRGERLLIMGFNGAGKTSLLRILAGVTEPNAGAVTTGLAVSVGYYAQEHEGIESGRSLLDHLRAHSPDLPDTELRRLLGMFGLTGAKPEQDAGTLSGGEKTKLALAQLVAGRHNLLLLDEPTNNLDPASRVAIGAALASWPGAIVLVSHDEEFVRELRPDRVLLMPDGALDSWRDELLELVALA
ncbi:MAG TPA: ABC-F family ATP-binding cassette domain-containing protein [Acidimicrobiales bacterium]|nr:ABC-F family ATP-binding cassette domain-containing protein [Acidimicrobiales bacterium]